MKTLRSLTFTFLAALLLAPSGRAVDAVVSTLEDELDANSSDGAGISLREAVRDVRNGGGGTITFASSLDGGVITLSVPLIDNTGSGTVLEINALALPSGLTVDGGGAQFFDCSNESLTLRGLTFRNGNSNDAPIGVGSGSLTVDRCTFERNNGVSGGCIIFNEVAAGLHRLTINACTFVRNRVGDQDGAAVVSGGGGAVQVVGGGSVVINNSTFTLNDAGHCIRRPGENYGGAILLKVFSGTCAVSHCTIAFNSSEQGGGGGIAVIDSPDAILTIENSIVAENEKSLVAAVHRVIAGKAGDDVFLANVSSRDAVARQVEIRGVCVIPGIRSDRLDAATTGSGLVTDADPQLGPLDANGGFTKTMALLPDSVARDRAPDPQSGLTEDQCGNPRKRGVRCDVGAVEYDPTSPDGVGVLVTTTADELDPPGTVGTGKSLREALRDLPRGGHIQFDPIFLSNHTITLDPALGPLRAGSKVAQLEIDARRIPATVNQPSASDDSPGVTINGGGQTQVLQVDPGVTMTLTKLKLTGGNGRQSNTGNFVGGGAIANGGDLALVECAVEGNTSVTRGGGIENSGVLLAQRCTFENNTANTIDPDAETGGGAVANLGEAKFENCTFVGNMATYGGAIDQTNIPGAANPVLSLNHCTITGNSTTDPEPDSGGGIYSFFDWTLANSIVAGNMPNDVTNDDLLGQQRAGKGLRGVANNIVLLFTNHGKTSGNGFLPNDPKLGTIGQYGGPTRTVPLLPGSFAINAPSLSLGADQRGFGIVDNRADLGAYEFGAFGAGEFKIGLADTSMALREGAAAPIVITDGSSEIAVTVKGDGSFKGTLSFVGVKYSFSGQFQDDRTASIQLTKKNAPTLTLDLTLSGITDNLLEAKVTGPGFSAETDISYGELAPKKGYLAPPELVGHYNGFIAGDGATHGVPVLAVVAFEITKTGNVRMVGSLLDGTKFLLGTRLSGSTIGEDLRITGDASLYGGKGKIAFNLAPQIDGSFATYAEMHRPPGVKPATPASLAGGFDHVGEVQIRRYLPPPKGLPPLVPLPGQSGFTANLITGTSGVAAAAFTLPANGKSKSLVRGFNLNVALKTGIFTGTYPNPAGTGKPLRFFGILMQDYALTGGFGISKDANVPYSVDIQPGP